MTDVPGRQIASTGGKTARAWEAPPDPPVPVWRRVLRGFATALILGGVLWIADHLR